MAIQSKLSFEDHIINGEKFTKEQEIPVPKDFEEFGDAVKGLFDKTAVLLEMDKKIAALPEELRQTLADAGIESVITETEHKYAHVLTGIYVQDARRNGDKFTTGSDPFFYQKHSAFREANGDGDFYNATLWTMSPNEFKNGPTVTLDQATPQYIKDKLSKLTKGKNGKGKSKGSK